MILTGGKQVFFKKIPLHNFTGENDYKPFLLNLSLIIQRFEEFKKLLKPTDRKYQNVTSNTCPNPDAGSAMTPFTF